MRSVGPRWAGRVRAVDPLSRFVDGTYAVFVDSAPVGTGPIGFSLHPIRALSTLSEQIVAVRRGDGGDFQPLDNKFVGQSDTCGRLLFFRLQEEGARTCKCMTTAAMAVVVLAYVSGAQADEVMEAVPVGNPGNPGDTQYPSGSVPSFGGVGYAYNIGKHEVTAGHYNAFLDAVAGGDTYGLCGTSMMNQWGCKIERLDGNATAGDPFQHRAAVDRADRPVNNVSWGDTARFSNCANVDAIMGTHLQHLYGEAHDGNLEDGHWLVGIGASDRIDSPEARHYPLFLLGSNYVERWNGVG